MGERRTTYLIHPVLDVASDAIYIDLPFVPEKGEEITMNGATWEVLRRELIIEFPGEYIVKIVVERIVSS